MVLPSQCQENGASLIANNRGNKNEDECIYKMELYSSLNINKVRKLTTRNVVLVRQLKLIKMNTKGLSQV